MHFLLSNTPQKLHTRKIFKSSDTHRVPFKGQKSQKRFKSSHGIAEQEKGVTPRSNYSSES